MTQENGMPIRFELVCKETGNVIGKVSREWFIGESFGTAYIDLDKHCLRQAIGVTSSDDPPQELYFGDLIEVAPIKDITKYPMIGELVWHKFGVYLRHWNTFERDFEYWSFHSFVKSKTPFTKLGSRYTKEGKEILKKAGLLESEDQ